MSRILIAAVTMIAVASLSGCAWDIGKGKGKAPPPAPVVEQPAIVK